jgi:hypothetical protein
VGAEGLSACADGPHGSRRLTWIIPRLAGGKTTAGPFVAVVDVSAAKRGALEARAWITTAEGQESGTEKNAAAFVQHVTLDRPFSPHAGSR